MYLSIKHVLSRSSSRLVIAMAVGYLPGFTLPFLVAAAFTRQQSDILLLAITTSVTSAAVIGIALETAWAAYVANTIVDGATVARKTLYAGVAEAAVVGVIVAIVLLPAFASPYLLRSNFDTTQLYRCLLALVPLPIFGAVSSVSSGLLNAHGRVATNLLLQGLRGILPAMSIVLGIDYKSIWVTAALLSFGELLRATISTYIACKLVNRNATKSAKRPSLKSILNHMGGLVLLGASPLVDRYFLSVAGVGAVTRYEMADRVFFAANQVSNNLLVLPRVRIVSQSINEYGTVVTLRREVRRVTALSLWVAGGVAVPVVAIWHVGPEPIGSAVPWALMLLASLPAAVGGAIATRLVVASRHSALIPVLSAGGVGLNIILDFVGYLIFGSVGVVVSTILLRYALLLGTVDLLVRAESKAEERSRSTSGR